MIKIKSDKIIAGDDIVCGNVYVNGDKIVAVTDEELAADVCYDYTGYYVSPGFIDTHTHGAGGFPFMENTVDDVVNGCNFQLTRGVTAIAPTISAAPYKVMKAAVANIAEAKKSGKIKNVVLGAHLEGPYLSSKQCGAQSPDFITPPIESDYKEIISEYGDCIARWTYAPENDVDGSFCKYLTSHGILASAGHTDAKYGDLKIAIDNGCKLITHLYSCTSTVTRDHGFRSLGVIESAFLRDDLNVEIIADGKHLPPDLVNMIIKIKGADRVALITDSMSVAGSDVKEGVMSGVEFVVEEGVARLKDRSAFAGSVATADRLIRVITDECGRPLTEAIKMYTQTPARIFGLNKGVLAEGKDADVIVFDDEISVKAAFVGGVKKL